MTLNRIINFFFIVSCLLVTQKALSQGFDPYSRVSDPRGICRLDGPDTMTVHCINGVGYTPDRDTDSYFICGKMNGAGILTHLWMEYYNAIDSLLKVRLWVDDSLIISCGIDSFYKQMHGAIRPPFDSLASGGFNCDVQIPYKRNFKVTFLYDYNYCCLFWGVEYRNLVDSSLIESFRIHPSNTSLAQQTKAEETYHNHGSPWKDANVKSAVFSEKILPGQKITIADLSGPAMIQTIRFLTRIPDSAALKKLQFKIFWDHSVFPSTDVPLADFFGWGAGPRDVQSFQVRAAKDGTLTSYLPMPFLKNARFVLENTSADPVSIDGEVDYKEEPVDRIKEGYFYSYFSESAPVKWNIYHPVANILGRGKYIGVMIALPDNPAPSFLEGDPIFQIDSDWWNNIRYTGLEDYLDGGWFFVDGPFSLPFAGCPIKFTSAYRFHYLDAYDFRKSFHFDIEHGVRNDFQTTYRTVAYFYRKWTPFWVDRDSVHRGDTWSFGGSGYGPGEVINAQLGTKPIFSITADAVGEFKYDYVLPMDAHFGISVLRINGVERPEPVFILDKPSVRYLNDSLPPIFRYKDSIALFGTGFKQGEKVSFFFDTTEAIYVSKQRIADAQNQFHIAVKMPWIPEGKYKIKAVGDQGTLAIADTALIASRVLNYECENIQASLAEGYTEASYLGYFDYTHWSNQYSFLFIPTGSGKKVILPFTVPVSDTFQISLWNTLGSRYGNYEISLDGEKILSFFPFIDTVYNRPFRSKELNGGVHYLSKGPHSITYLCIGKEPKGLDYLLNADNFILTPVTAFHPIPPDTDLSATPERSLKSGISTFTISPNPLSGKILTFHLNLDSTFRLGSDILTIELYDILGRKVATVLDGTLGVGKLEVTKDCSALPSGKYICRILKASSSGVTTQSVTFIIAR